MLLKITLNINTPSQKSEVVSKYLVIREVQHQLLFGGDQLTASRARGCKAIRMNSATDTEKLCGLIPVAEDWHTKVTLLEVSK